MSHLAGGYYRHLVYKGLARIYSCYNVEDSPFLQNYQAQNVTSAGVEKLWYKAKLTSKTKTNINFLLSCPSGCNTLNASPHHSQTIYGYFDRISLFPHSIQKHCIYLIQSCCSSLMSKDTGQINFCSVIYHFVILFHYDCIPLSSN